MQIRAITLFAVILPLSAAITEPVQVEQGSVSSVAGSSADVRVFKGIPFAAPPVGDLRWKAPKAPVKWTGVRSGDKFGPVCMQRRAAKSGRRDERGLPLPERLHGRQDRAGP